MTRLNKTPLEIDLLLPQTQCGLCGYGGCLPYAQALVHEGAAINLCPPGGVDTLINLGEALGINPEPYKAEMARKAKPPTQAIIREAECIGCTKCIQACPVDAILGASKLMHTVIGDECTGCELCVPPCPVDCISLVPATHAPTPEHARTRYRARTKRLKLAVKEKKFVASEKSKPKKISYIEAAIARVKERKSALKK